MLILKQTGIVYLSTMADPDADAALDRSLNTLLTAASASVDDSTPPQVLYRLYYEQAEGPSSTSVDGRIVNMPCSSVALAFDDATLQSVRDAWDHLRESDDGDYMKFDDREGQDDVDDI